MPCGSVVPEGCWEGRAPHSSAFSSPWPHCWPFSLRPSSLGCVWWSDTDIRTSFLPHLCHVRVGNGRRSLQFSLVADLTYEVLLFYSGIIRLWEIYPYSLQTHSVIRTREVWSLHWAECLDLLPETLRKAGTQPEVAWWAAITAGRVHPGPGGDWRVKLLSVHILLFWQSTYSCLT